MNYFLKDYFLGHTQITDIHASTKDESAVVVSNNESVLLLSVNFFRCTSPGTGCIDHEEGEMSLFSCYFEKCQSTICENNKRPNVIRSQAKLSAQHTVSGKTP